jgi:hypothetical protein
MRKEYVGGETKDIKRDKGKEERWLGLVVFSYI